MIGTLVSDFRIPQGMVKDIHKCRIKLVKTSSYEKCETFSCGSRINEEKYILCPHHQALLNEYEGYDIEMQDFIPISKRFNYINEETKQNLCERIGSFFRRHPYLVVMLAATSVISGIMIYRSKYNNEPSLPDAGQPSKLKGGRSVKKGEHKDVVFVYSETEDKAFGCTGISLSENIILTAQHCVSKQEIKEVCSESSIIDTTTTTTTTTTTDLSQSYYYDDYDCHTVNGAVVHSPPENITVFYGTEIGYGKLWSRRYEVESILRHPLFNITSRNSTHDIALLKLKKQIKGIPLHRIINKHEHEIMLNQFKENDKDPPKFPKNLRMEAWGRVENPNVTPDSLGFYNINESADMEAKRLQTSYRKGITNNCESLVICSSGDGTGICEGDSGGPVFWKNVDNEEVIVGINSKGFGFSCLFPDAIHVDLHYNNKWIDEGKISLNSTNKSHRKNIFFTHAFKDFNNETDCDEIKMEKLKKSTYLKKEKLNKCKIKFEPRNSDKCKEKKDKYAGFKKALKQKEKSCNITNIPISFEDASQ